MRTPGGRLVLLSLLLVAGLPILFEGFLRPPVDTGPTVYCAASLRAPLEALVGEFEEETGMRVLLEHGSSGELEGKLILEGKVGAPRCDIYLPADPWFQERARARGLVGEPLVVARSRIVLAHLPGTDLSVTGVVDLLRQGHAYVLCNQEAGAGRRTRLALEKYGLWERVHRNRTASFLRVPEAAGAVRLRPEIGAALIWDSTARQFGLRTIDCPELASAVAHIAASISRSAPNRPAAERFLRFLASPGHGGRHFREHHFGTESDWPGEADGAP